MNLIKNIFRLVRIIIITTILTTGCAQKIPLNLNLNESIQEEIFGKMNTNEVVFIKSILFSDDPHTKGSFAWMEKSFQQELQANENVRIGSNAILVVFFYPTGYLPADYESGVVFTNVHQVEKANSADEYTEWVNIARLQTDKVPLPQVSCRLMLWISPEPQDVETETLIEVAEKFELKDNCWHPLRIRRELAK